ncbi:MAG: hypothetical protein A4S14_15870 [Proteobacteria bacterium SG_bin9]|nr:MAG: hypothetical protein A4S14_15870 [Proteobacteria bacterium SG_bin9]
MTEIFERDSDIAAAYVLGLVRGAERDAVTSRLATDEALRSLVEHWQQTFATIDGSSSAAPEETPSAGTFEAVLDRIDSEGLQLPGTKTRRAGTAKWREVSPGIHTRVLYADRVTNRLSVLVRMEPGATFRSHSHDLAEETLVLEGELWLGDLKLMPGDHHLAQPHTQHPLGRTVTGCIVHITRSLSDS